MKLTPASSTEPTVLATPDQLDEIATHTIELGRRVEDVGTAVAAALRDLALALPASAAAATAPEAGVRCAEVLRAEGAALRSFGGALAAAAAAYRANDARLSGRVERMVR